MEEYQLNDALKAKIKAWVEKEERSYRIECVSDYKTYLIEDCIGEMDGYKDEEKAEAIADYIRELLNLIDMFEIKNTDLKAADKKQMRKIIAKHCYADIEDVRRLTYKPLLTVRAAMAAMEEWANVRLNQLKENIK